MISPKTPNIHHRISSFIPKLQNSSQNSKSHLKIISKFHSIIPSLMTNFQDLLQIPHFFQKFQTASRNYKSFQNSSFQNSNHHVSSKNSKLHPKILRFIPSSYWKIQVSSKIPISIPKFKSSSQNFKFQTEITSVIT